MDGWEKDGAQRFCVLKTKVAISITTLSASSFLQPSIQFSSPPPSPPSSSSSSPPSPTPPHPPHLQPPPLPLIPTHSCISLNIKVAQHCLFVFVNVPLRTSIYVLGEKGDKLAQKKLKFETRIIILNSQCTLHDISSHLFSTMSRHTAIPAPPPSVLDTHAPPPGFPTNQNRFAYTSAAPPTSSTSSPLPRRVSTRQAGPFTTSLRTSRPISQVASSPTAASAAAAEASAASALAAAAAADAVVAAALRDGSRPLTRVVDTASRRGRQVETQRPVRVARNRKHVPGEPAALSKGFAAAYGISESLKQYGISHRPASAPGKSRSKSVPDEARRNDPPFVHTIQYMGRHGPVSARVNPRLSTRVPRQRPRSKYNYAKNATSRRPSSAWFEHPRQAPLVADPRPAWR